MGTGGKFGGLTFLFQGKAERVRFCKKKEAAFKMLCIGAGCAVKPFAVKCCMDPGTWQEHQRSKV